MEIQYTAHASATGGGRHDGHSKTDDGKVDVKISSPREMGGPGGEGTNPEQLFATGYAACYLGALRAAAGKDHVKLPDDTRISADVGVGKRDDGQGLGLKVTLTATVPGHDAEKVKAWMDAAHIICPYSHATRGNIEVNLEVG
ncbi:organic hydroperoxide resistance protein [Pelagibacterium xiamenense]|uniref:organic hydroperoxide resistance protein n=1 Tax=Pelagibacterium xiamenense TaxID=2901140 RepID=UPI001E28250B|nr:organic hydroperoxide resistance protein [Pelagibacterium xiamenense]MCD7058480.1 organic hydroperoxide resistance protein [Pelagibacterium xiamenense]